MPLKRTWALACNASWPCALAVSRTPTAAAVECRVSALAAAACGSQRAAPPTHLAARTMPRAPCRAHHKAARTVQEGTPLLCVAPRRAVLQERAQVHVFLDGRLLRTIPADMVERLAASAEATAHSRRTVQRIPIPIAVHPAAAVTAGLARLLA
jgi:hypothetical protein